MAGEGRPTGITREDVETLSRDVRFEGRPAQLFYKGARTAGGQEYVVIRVDVGGTRLELYGRFKGGEFMELDRERLD